MIKGIQNFIDFCIKNWQHESQRSLSGILEKLSLCTVSQDSSIMNSTSESNNSYSDYILIVKGLLTHLLLQLIGWKYYFRLVIIYFHWKQFTFITFVKFFYDMVCCFHDLVPGLDPASFVISYNLSFLPV